MRVEGMKSASGFRFERILVWQKAMGLTRRIYEFTGSFPDSERFGLSAQLRRAAVSVPSNIAEGSSRATNADFARFVEIAYGSLMESVCQCRLATDLGYLPAAAYDILRDQSDEIARMLSGLRNYLVTKKNTKLRELPALYGVAADS